MKTKAHLLALEENKTLRSYLREIYGIVGHSSTFSDACPAEMLAVVAFEVASEIDKKNKIIAEKDGQISQMQNLIKELYAELDKLYGRVAEANADLADENKILRGYLQDILDIVGHGSTFSDDCPAEMLAYIVKEVAGEIEDKDNIIEATDALRTSDKHFIKSLNEQIDSLTSDLGECRINLREADAKSTSTTDKYGLMLGRIGQMIPVEFYRTPESTVEQAVALLLDRYYSEMATNMYNQNQKLENK